jgi:RNA polymerase sigma-70 factor (ECF subfamily)
MDRNRDLFWKLVEPEHHRARAYCRKLTGDRDNGDDLYQDALVCALTGFNRLRRIEAFRPWLYRIIINNFRNRIKQPWWRRVGSLTPQIEETLAGDNPLPRQAARKRLEIAFRAVSPEERALVTLFELEGWAIKEIAELTGQSSVNVRVRLSRARGRMRRALTRYMQRSGSEKSANPLASKDKVCVVQKPAED